MSAMTTKQRKRLMEIVWRPREPRRPGGSGRRLKDVAEMMVHGTPSTYTNYGCRCDECRLAMKRYQAERRAYLVA